MIDSVAEFSDQLNRLDPDDVAFVLHVDDLIEQTSPATLKVAYPVIFQFFEAHPEKYCGAPGTLVHTVEDFYPNYIDELIESVSRMPSVNAVWMVNRILNSDIEGDLRHRLIDCLKVAFRHSNASPCLQNWAQQFLEQHS